MFSKQDNSLRADLAQEAGDFFCRYSPQGVLTFINSACAEYFGRQTNELIGKRFFPLLSPEERDCLKDRLFRLTADKPVVTTEHKVVLATGAERWQQWTNTALFGQRGELLEFQAVGRDVTENKRTETSKFDKDVLLKMLADITPVGYLIVSSQDDIVYFNREFCRIWDFSHLADQMRQGIMKHSDIVKLCKECIRNAPEGLDVAGAGGPDMVNSEITLNNGRIIRFSSCQVRDDHKLLRGKVFIFEDITDQKLTEEQLLWHRDFLEQLVHKRTVELKKINDKLEEEIAERRSAQNILEMYQILAGKARDIILFISPDGRIVEANEAAANCYGYTREELLQMALADLTVDKTGVAARLAQAVEGRLYESVHTRKDGTTFHVEVNSQGTVIKDKQVLLSIVRDISERKRLEEQLNHLAHYDYLTGIPNRYYLEQFVKQIHGGSNRQNALLFVDIDNFKMINDLYGHTVGDSLLANLAKLLQSVLAPSDFLARLGGDEFAIVLPDTNVGGARLVAKKIMKTIQTKEFSVSDTPLSVTVTASIGISILDSSVEFEHLFAYADTALYTAKEEGKNRVFVISDHNDKVKFSRINKVLGLINNALREDKFALQFQPIFKAHNQLLHYEALLRLHDGGKIISPAEFIPVAERFGLMTLIDKWVIGQALEILRENPNVIIFVNLSGVSLSDSALLDWIETTVKEDCIEPSQIGFEITETAAVRDISKAERWIRRLKAIGCRFALDDFGVGFSSFSHLNLLPIDYLKIDGSFVRNLDKYPTQRALVEAMNAAAHALGKETIAECVENEAIWRILQQLRVDCGQGYYLGRPGKLPGSNTQ